MRLPRRHTDLCESAHRRVATMAGPHCGGRSPPDPIIAIRACAASLRRRCGNGCAARLRAGSLFLTRNRQPDYSDFYKVLFK
jgi:hypothetical protein